MVKRFHNNKLSSCEAKWQVSQKISCNVSESRPSRDLIQHFKIIRIQSKPYYFADLVGDFANLGFEYIPSRDVDLFRRRDSCQENVIIGFDRKEHLHQIAPYVLGNRDLF